MSDEPHASIQSVYETTQRDDTGPRRTTYSLTLRFEDPRELQRALTIGVVRIGWGHDLQEAP